MLWQTFHGTMGMKKKRDSHLTKRETGIEDFEKTATDREARNRSQRTRGKIAKVQERGN